VTLDACRLGTYTFKDIRRYVSPRGAADTGGR
jgi:hypothetical protein